MFIERKARARFIIGDRQTEPECRRRAPAETPHKVVNIGERRPETTGIPLSERRVPEDVRNPERQGLGPGGAPVPPGRGGGHDPPTPAMRIT